MNRHIYTTFCSVTLASIFALFVPACGGGDSQLVDAEPIKVSSWEENERLLRNEIFGGAISIYQAGAMHVVVSIYRHDDKREPRPQIQLALGRAHESGEEKWRISQFVNNRRGEYSLELREDRNIIDGQCLMIYEHSELIECLVLNDKKGLYFASGGKNWNELKKYYGSGGRRSRYVELDVESRKPESEDRARRDQESKPTGTGPRTENGK